MTGRWRASSASTRNNGPSRFGPLLEAPRSDAGVSTSEQNIEGQTAALGVVGCKKVFADRGVGGGHAHPHFVWERDKGVRCGSRSRDIIRSRMDVDDFNARNVNFSANDKRAARGTNGGAGRPLYLVVPERNWVKVYRKNASGRWRQSACL